MSIHRGYTIIEVMVVVTIVGILLAIAVPGFRDYFDRARVRGAADDISALMANARAEAVKSDRDVAVAVTGAGAVWCIGAASAPNPAAVGQPIPNAVACDCTNAAQCFVSGRRSVVSSADYRGVQLGAGAGAVTFESKLGMIQLASTAGFAEPAVTVDSATGKYQLRVTVSALGHVRSCVPGGKPYIAGLPNC